MPPVAAVAALLASAPHPARSWVSADGLKIAGIVSERDIVRALADRGPTVLNESAAAIMTSAVFTCARRDHGEQLMGLMTNRRIRHVPVVVDGRLTGLVSIGDAVMHRMSELETETQVLHDYITHGRR